MTYLLIFVLTCVMCYHYYVVDRLQRRIADLEQDQEFGRAALSLAQAIIRHHEGQNVRVEVEGSASV